jgi:ATP-binding cassette, subfamily C, bacterial CydC
VTADLLRATQDRTTLLITHDLDGLDQLDEIIILDHDQVTHRGRHDELISRPGTYGQMQAAHLAA